MQDLKDVTNRRDDYIRGWVQEHQATLDPNEPQAPTANSNSNINSNEPRKLSRLILTLTLTPQQQLPRSQTHRRRRCAHSSPTRLTLKRSRFCWVETSNAP